MLPMLSFVIVYFFLIKAAELNFAKRTSFISFEKMVTEEASFLSLTHSYC